VRDLLRQAWSHWVRTVIVTVFVAGGVLVWHGAIAGPAVSLRHQEKS
jgi:hypothetical protein